jgi:RNA polymerase sigma-70 factor (ECF subfamily)
VKEENVQAARRELRQVPSASDAKKETRIEALFREYHQLVFRTAYRVTGSAVDAEDVLQTVFMRLIAAEREDLSPSPASYLHRAAINASLDLMRAYTRARSQSLDTIDRDSLPSPGPGPEAARAAAEIRNHVRKSIAQLGDKAAQVIALRYFEGYGNREIAEILGTSHLVVGVILHRARGRLRAEFRKFLEGNHETH